MKTFVSIIVLIGFSFGVIAQENSPHKRKGMEPEAKAERMTQRMAEELSLTDEQKSKVYALNLEQAKRQTQHRQSMQAQRKEMYQAREAILAEVLSEEQKALRQEKMADRKEKWQENRQEPRGEGHKNHRPKGKREGKK